MANNLVFQPWIGNEYGKSEFGKLFIVGESHYDYEGILDYKNYTTNIISKLGSKADNDFYIKVGQLFNENDYLFVWPKIAFANGIQYLFDESRPVKTAEHNHTIEPAIKEYLNIIKPSKMLVCSQHIWNKGLPTNISWGRYIGRLKDEENNKESSLWEFEYEGGICLSMGIHHPGSTRPKFRVEEWRPIVKKFLGL